MTVLFHPNDNQAREALENFCFTHPLTLHFKRSANPMERMGNKLYEIISTLEIARPHLYQGEFVDCLKDQFHRYVDMETSTTNAHALQLLKIQKMMVYQALQAGEPELNSIADNCAYITQCDSLEQNQTGCFYSVEELKINLLSTVKENQDKSNFPYPGECSQYYFKIPRGIYDALLCICANKLNPTNTSTPEFAYW